MQEENTRLKAFVNGYTACKVKESDFTAALRKYYPSFACVVFPGKKIWQGYGFIKFDSEMSYLNFIKQKKIRLPEFNMNLIIQPYKEGKELKKSLKECKKRRMRIERIPEDWDEEKLDNFFRKFGPLENSFIKRKRATEHLREAIIMFKKRKAALKCFLEREILQQEYSIKIQYNDKEYHDLKTKEQALQNEHENSELEGQINFEQAYLVNEREAYQGNLRVPTQEIIDHHPQNMKKRNKPMISWKIELSLHQTKPTSIKYFQLLSLFPNVGYLEKQWNYRINNGI